MDEVSVCSAPDAVGHFAPADNGCGPVPPTDVFLPCLSLPQVEDGGRAFLAGVQNGDEVVSLNGEPCADLTLLQANALVETSIECLQLLVKRYCHTP